MSLFLPPSLRTCDASHRWSPGRRHMRLRALRSESCVGCAESVKASSSKPVAPSQMTDEQPSIATDFRNKICQNRK